MYNRSGCGLLVHLVLLLQYVVDFLGREGTLQFLPIQQLLFKHIKRLYNNNKTPAPVESHTQCTILDTCAPVVWGHDPPLHACSVKCWSCDVTHYGLYYVVWQKRSWTHTASGRYRSIITTHPPSINVINVYSWSYKCRILCFLAYTILPRDPGIKW